MRTTCLFLTTAILGGCVGSIESKEARVKVAELSSGELDALCEWLEDTTEQDDANGTQMCTLAAVDSAEDALSCSSYRDDCISALPQAGRYHPGEVCAKKKKKSVPVRCTATVRQLKACFVARQQEVVSAAQAASCWDLENSRLTGSKLISCTNVLPNCEGLFAKHASYEIESYPDDVWTDDSFDDEYPGGDEDEDVSDDEAIDDEALDDEAVDDEPADNEATGDEPTEEPPADDEPTDELPTEPEVAHMDGGTH
jgi:hypothetical protein